MLSAVKATIRRGRISGKMALTVTTHLTEIAASTNKYFVMHLYKGTEKVTRDMVGTTIVAETTMVDGVMAVGPGNVLPAIYPAKKCRGLHGSRHFPV